MHTVIAVGETLALARISAHKRSEDRTDTRVLSQHATVATDGNCRFGDWQL